MKQIIDLIKLLIKSPKFWQIVSQIAGSLLDLLRQQKQAKTDEDRSRYGAEFAKALEQARLKRLELEIELKKRELELQRALLELEKNKLRAEHATSKRSVTSAQKDLLAAQRTSTKLSERAEEVSHAVAILRQVEIAGDARDQRALQEMTSALVVVVPEG